MTAFILLEQLDQYLVDQGVVRGDNGTPGPLPPLWRNPIDGPRQPESADQAAVTIRPAGQMPTDWLEGFLENAVVEVIVRARHAGQGELLQRQIRVSLNDRHSFTMGGLHVQSCRLVRGLQPMPLAPNAATKTWDTTQSFLFQVRVADLTVA